MMLKLFFVPLNVIGGIAAGAVGKKTFEARWVAFDDEQAPPPQDLLKKLIAALMLEGAILRAVRGLSDHGARHAFRKLAGSWPPEHICLDRENEEIDGQDEESQVGGSVRAAIA